MKVADLQAELRKLANAQRKAISQTFFKTGKGEYAEGDQFIGVSVPDIRKIIKNYLELELSDVFGLLQSKIHEERLAALVLLVTQFEKGDAQKRKTIFDQYLVHTAWINNWDLVDTSAPQIVGGFLSDTNRDVLLKLIASPILWERRIAMVSTLFFIRAGETTWTTRLAQMVLTDTHDLMHKATGWMLREMGKRDEVALHAFLQTHAHHMPKTMLRYAIERLSPRERERYLKKGSDLGFLL